MDAKVLVLKSLEQSQGYLTSALDGLTQEESAWKPGIECNNIAFILWHIARVEDFFVNRLVRRQKEINETGGFQERLGTPVKAFGLTLDELKAWPVPKLDDLRAYAKAVRDSTLAFLSAVPSEKLDEVPRPDRSPDSIGASLGHMATEIALHVGQICYLRGLQRGLDK